MHSQAGSSFIEIIVSMFLLSIIILGVDAMQITALREAEGAYYFSVAMQQLHNMSERLDSMKTSEEISEEINEQAAIWNKQNEEVLPNGRGSISGHYPYLNLAIFWGDATEQTCRTNKTGQSGCLYF